MPSRPWASRAYQMVLRANRGKGLYDLGDIPGAEAELRRDHRAIRAPRRRRSRGPMPRKRTSRRLLAWTASPDRFDEAEQLAREVIAAKNASLTGTAYGALSRDPALGRATSPAPSEGGPRRAAEVARPFPSYAADITAHHARILIELGRAEEALAITEAATVRELERLRPRLGLQRRDRTCASPWREALRRRGPGWRTPARGAGGRAPSPERSASTTSPSRPRAGATSRTCRPTCAS